MWDKPSIAGRFDESCNCNRSANWGWSNFISHSQMRRRSFLKNDDLIIFAEFNGKDPFPDSPYKIGDSFYFHAFKSLLTPVSKISSNGDQLYKAFLCPNVRWVRLTKGILS